MVVPSSLPPTAPRRRTRPPAALLALAAGLGASAPAAAQAPAADPVVRLQARLDAGTVELAWDTLRGWLPSVLEALDVPASSQTLVFSRTSLQTDRIGPWTPRALYFNDDVYVGFVQEGGLLEVAAVEAAGGTAFYSLPQSASEEPRFFREGRTCLMCHESRSLTGGVPGLIMRSVLPDRLGYPIGEVHEDGTTDRTPVERRWGGWYVTGIDTAVAHAGNAHAPDLRHEVPNVRRYVEAFDFLRSRSATPARERFDASQYLTPHSDVVALAVLAHQVEVHNLIAQVHDVTRQAARTSGLFGPETVARAVWDDLEPHARTRVDGVVDRLVASLLFAGEQPWPGPVVAGSGFAEEFAVRGPFDGRGRSLRDFDLESRLFRYPLSFLVYSEPFAALPRLVRVRVAGKLARALGANGATGDAAAGAPGDGAGATGDPTGATDGTAPGGGPAAHLDPEVRRAILEIVRDTRPELLDVP